MIQEVLARDLLDDHTSTTEIIMQTGAAGYAAGTTFGIVQVAASGMQGQAAFKNIFRTGVRGGFALNDNLTKSCIIRCLLWRI